MLDKNQFIEVYFSDFQNLEVSEVQAPSDLYLYLERARRFILFKRMGETLQSEETIQLETRGFNSYFIHPAEEFQQGLSILERLRRASINIPTVEEFSLNQSVDNYTKLNYPRTEAGTILKLLQNSDDLSDIDKKLILEVLSETITELEKDLPIEKVFLDIAEYLNLDHPQIRIFYSLFSTKKWHTERQKKLLESLLITQFSPIR